MKSVIKILECRNVYPVILLKTEQPTSPRRDVNRRQKDLTLHRRTDWKKFDLRNRRLSVCLYY